eukprot:m.5190 g.5190  ORF g.5190 m.5190 type:complete len:721 (-) comp2355_c0_seq1:136-2298(-)
MTVITLATCSLNQWALDFEGNYLRILASIKEAKEAGAVFRLGPELEISGYGCNDHFYESDTFLHCYQILADLITHEDTRDIVVDVGLPVMHKSVRYNCRAIFYNGKLLLIRPKMVMAMNGNYREQRWFTPWQKNRFTENMKLPLVLRKATGQETVPFGDGIISSSDVCIGSEICEELWSPMSSHMNMGLDGVHIFTNGSGSHHELRKLNSRLDLILNATRRIGGIYMYANCQGNDGERVYYDGCAVIALNGELLAQGSQFSLKDVEVVTATIDINEIRTYRGARPSYGIQSARSDAYPRISIDIELCDTSPLHRRITQTQEPFFHTPEEEIALGPACWLWDYLRRSGLGGFFLPLSGGLDSASTAAIVFSMCKLVHDAVANGSEAILVDLRRVVNDVEFVPKSPQDVAERLFYTMYMGTVNSSSETRDRAKTLAAEIGAVHYNIDIDSVVSAVRALFTTVTGINLKFKTEGGSYNENIALQNIQARMRMVMAYLFGLLLPWAKGRKGTLLVLGSANVDECLRGYMTKYDCSSADINPIGGISKVDLKRFIGFASKNFSLPSLDTILSAKPTAELEPITEEYTQTDEDDMGMTYEELGVYGRLRKVQNCGPFSMFCKLSDLWRDKFTIREIGDKVKYFFRMYAINRHKATVITPSYHAESYSPDDNRFDLRPFLYNTKWEVPFRCIDSRIEALEHAQQAQSSASEATVEPDILAINAVERI